MKNAFKVVLALCLLASSVNAAPTVWGSSAQLNAAGSLSDCAGAGAGVGTNAKAISLMLPSWATAADVDVSGTFVATYGLFGSTDGVNYRAANGFTSSVRSVAISSSSVLGWTVSDIGIRYVCVALTAYTSGTVVVTIEPRAAPAGVFILTANGGTSIGSPVLGTSSSIAQGAASSSSVSLLTVQASQIGINSTPAVNTQASASVAAGSATVRHMAARCSGSIATVAAQTQINLNLRDGATGAGTILWAGTILCAISSPCVLDSGPINTIGTAATAMTCEWSGVPAVGNFEVANLEYKNAG